MLVNNAGFGLPLSFARNDIDDEVGHLDLLVQVPMRLTHAVLAPMLLTRVLPAGLLASVGERGR